eukprot:383349_1
MIVSESTREALTQGLMLHEKGRLAVKKENVPKEVSQKEALLLLRAAEEAYRRADPEILDSVDNYPAVCLSICWLYFLGHDIGDLKEVDRLLKAAERGFSKAYGSDLSRLRALKGEFAAELAVCPTLHLLKGVLLFLMGEVDKAIVLIIQAKQECVSLQCPPSMVRALIIYRQEVYGEKLSKNAAQTALRAGKGTLKGAISYLDTRQSRLGRVEVERQRQKEDRQASSVAFNEVSNELEDATETNEKLQLPKHGRCTGGSTSSSVGSVDKALMDEIAKDIGQIGDECDTCLDASLVLQSEAAELYLLMARGSIPLNFDIGRLKAAMKGEL